MSVDSRPQDGRTPVSHPRLWPAIVILILGIGRQLWIWNVWPPDRTVQTIHAYISGGPAILLLGIWWLFLSRVSWRIRGVGVGIVALCLALLACVIRYDDVTGEVFPIFAWRWTPRRADVAKAYLREQRELQREAARKKAAEQPKPNPKDKTDDTVDQKQADTTLASAETTSGKKSATSLVAEPKPSVTPMSDADWPEFRGRFRDGVARDTLIRTDWDSKPPVALWRHPVGPGWSSFSIVDGLAFTQEQRQDDQDHDAESVVCYDVWTGKQLWEYQDLVKFTHVIGGDGPRATPTWHKGRLYTFGGTGILNCFDASTGKKQWSHDVLVENSITNAEYGMTGSPLIHEDLVIVNPGGSNGHALMAFDRLSGMQVWSTGDDGAGYTSLQVSEVDGVSQLLVFDAVGIAGHDLKSGEKLWKFPWTNGSGINAAQPIVVESNHVFVSTSYGIGSVMLHVQQGPKGWTVEPLWESKQIRLKFNGGVVRDHYLYGLDEGILACFDLRDGTKKWKGGRYSFGQVLLIGDNVLVLAESGEVVLVAASPDRFQELTRFQAIEGKTWNNPALWKGLLLVRNGSEAACYDLRIE